MMERLVSKVTSGLELRYTALEKINCKRPVDRIRYFQKVVEGKIVLDLGALDETAYVTKCETDFWLHGVMAKSAKKLIGVDSSDLLDHHPSGLKAYENSVIFKGNVFDLSEIIKSNSDIELVVAGEILEHLENPLQFLRTIRQYKGLSGKKIYISTPNACTMSNVLIGLFRRESTHHDHVNIFSYKVLNTLCIKTNIKRWSIIPYYSAYTEMISNSSGIKKLGVKVFERFTRLLQFIFPLLGGGWIVEIEL